MLSVSEFIAVVDRVLSFRRQPQAPRAIAARLRKIMRLIQTSRPDLSIAVMAETVGAVSVGDFESRLTGKIEADFAWIDKLCGIFGANSNWVKSGFGAPFLTPLERQGDPRSYELLIDELQPAQIGFVRSSGAVGEITMVFGWNDTRYLVAGDVWHLSEHVGGTGARQIYEFYLFLQSMKSMFRKLRPAGRVVNPEVFEDLVLGQIYPAAVFEGRDAPWWDDFTDVEHRWPIAKNYRSLWGESFIHAQAQVRHFLAKEPISKR